MTIGASSDNQSSIYSVVEAFTSGSRNTIHCNDESHLAIAGSAVRDDGFSREHRTIIRDNVLEINLDASEFPVTGVLLCIIIQ